MMPAFAFYTLLRAAADATVRCRHLLEPGITEPERLARGMNERLDNLRQQGAVDPETLGAHFDRRLAHMKQRAEENGISLRWDKGKDGGKLIGFNEPVKKDLDLFRLYFSKGSTAFRYLSGYVHSKPWVLIPRHRARPSADPDVSLAETRIEIEVFVPLLESVMDLVDETIGDWLSLAEHTPDVWSSAKKQGL